MMKLRNPLLLSVLAHGAVIVGGGALLARDAEFAMGGLPARSASRSDITEIDLVVEPPPVLDPETQEEDLPPIPDVSDEVAEMIVPTPVPTRRTPTPRPTPAKTKSPPLRSNLAPRSAATPHAERSDERSISDGSSGSQSASSEASGSDTPSEHLGHNSRNAEPDYLRNPAPPYPTESRRAGEEGTVVLRVRINSSGSVEDLSIKNSSGFVRLDSAAERAVRSWTFRPAYIGGMAVTSTVEVPVTFRLTGQRR